MYKNVYNSFRLQSRSYGNITAETWLEYGEVNRGALNTK